MKTTSTTLLVLVSAVAFVGCKGTPNEKRSEPTKPDPKPATATSAKVTETPPAAATASTTPPTDVKPELTDGRSVMPTLEEWATQKKEVTVKGSSALKCETKILREYLRVSCRGKNDTGGAPATVKVVKGGREALAFAGGGVTSLIVPFVEGTDFAADFSWTDKSHRLVVQWPKGAPKPTIVGTFEGAKSPLDGTADGDSAKLCECHKKVTGAKNCDELMGAPDADCDRTYGGDCPSLLACSVGEPSRPPRCLPGFQNAGAIMRCYKKCDGEGSCPAGRVCQEWGDARLCMEE